MEYCKRLDMHTHTDNSPDGNEAIMYMCEVALENKLRAIAFTDHCEVDTISSNNYIMKSVDQAYFEMMKAKDVYRGRIIVNAGIELGQPMFDIENAQKIVNRHKYDIILASLHNRRDGKDYYYMDYTKVDVDEILRDYFENLLEIAKWEGFDSLAHLTYPLRYIKGKYKIDVNLSKYNDYIDEILKTLIKNEKALEINTSGLRQPINETLPPACVVKRFHDFGGKYITTGSDAHKVEHIGFGIDCAMKIAKESGFNYITLFQNRTPSLIPIE